MAQTNAHIITATLQDRSSITAAVSITVNDVPPRDLTYSESTPIYKVGTAIAPTVPTSAGGAVVSYTIAPALPAGLALDPFTGLIAGTPTESIAPTEYLVTGSNTGGNTTAVLNITVLPAPPDPPQDLWVEPGDNEVELTWSPAPRAESYVVLWADSPDVPEPLFNRVTGVSGPPWKHTGLLNQRTYRYRVAGVNAGGEGLSSPEASGEPGPVPGPVLWTVAVTEGGAHRLFWSSALAAERYRVYFAGGRTELQGRRPPAAYVETLSSSLTVTADLGEPTYFRVIATNGSRIGTGGYPAVSTSFQLLSADDVPYVTPALWDINGDGCLDVVGADGDCAGSFRTYPLADRGLEGLFANNRVDRDSRIADFTGDGHVDIFTNVYARADDPTSRAILHVNDGTGHFTEDPAVAAMQIGGFGETIVAADFDNDGDLDIFVPHYWHRDDGGHNWLLINDGRGGFTDMADRAGVARGIPRDPFIPEGAQALDFNQDGWIDIFVASQLFINNGDGTFTNRAMDCRLPVRFDEGAAFADVDLDGDFDFITNDYVKTALYRNDNDVFDDGTTLPGESPERIGAGLSVCDVNGDSFPDVLVPGNDGDTNTGAPSLFINVGGSFVMSDLGIPRNAYVDLIACADLDRNGMNDALARWSGYQSLVNRADSPGRIRVRVLGKNGERNQQGRVVHITPQAAPTYRAARVIESGSGYMAQGDYDLLVGAPWPGSYDVAVRFADRVLVATVYSGDDVTFFADGRAEAGLR